MEYIKECLRVIDAHPMMQGIAELNPLSQAEGAREAPFQLEGYVAAIAAGGTAKAGCNFFWQDFQLDTLTAHVPLKRSSMDRMASTRFAKPEHVTDIYVAMGKGENPLNFKGRLRRLSPAEPSHAMLMAIRRDVEIGDETVIQAWRHIALGTTMVFHEFETPDQYHFAHLQLRENPGIDFELVRHTALQRVLDIAQFHARTAAETGVKLSAKALSATYTQRLHLAEQSEKITDSLCEMALSVNSRLVKTAPDVFQCLLDLDESEGVHNPLDAVTKLQALVTKAGTKENLQFMVPLLIDLYKSGALPAEKCTVRALKGAGTGSQVKGTCDVLLVKQDLLESLLRWTAEEPFPGAIVNQMRRITISIPEFRKHCGRSWKTGDVPTDLGWKAGWKNSAELLLNVFEMVVFHTEYDDAILTLLKGKKTASDMLAAPPLKDLLDEIKTALSEEAEAAEATKASLPATVTDPEAADNMDDDADACMTAQGIEGDPALKELDDLGENESRKLERFKRQAEQLVAAHVTIVDECKTDAEILAILKDCPAGKARGDPAPALRTHVLIYYDQQDAGEANAQPHLRTPPMRAKGQHLQRFLSLCIQRANPDELEENDVYIVNDAGRAGNKTMIMNAFHNSAGQVIAKKALRTVTLMVSEESLAVRVDKSRGFGSINQLQNLHMISKAVLQLNHHERLYSSHATNRGNVLGPLPMDPLDDPDKTWALKVKDKFTLFGRHGPRIPVGGGPGAGADVDVDDELSAVSVKFKPRDKTMEEPFLFHSVPQALFNELCHSHDAVAFIGMAGDGKAALTALERRLPFFGLSFTPEHTAWLTKRLEAQVFKRFQDPQSKLYQSGLSIILAKGQPAPAGGEGNVKPKRTAAAAAGGGPPAKLPKTARGNPAPTPTGSQAFSADDILAKVKAMAAAAMPEDDE